MRAYLSFLLNLIFIEAHETNCFADCGVKEWRNKISYRNFNPSIVHLRSVYAIVVLYVVTLPFVEKSYENMYIFVRKCNNLIG